MKKIIALFAFCASCMGAQASYLYWQVDSSDYQGMTAASEVNYFSLWATGNGDTFVIDDYNAGSPSSGLATKPAMAVDVTDYSSYSFYVELGNYNNGNYSVLGKGETLTYSQLGSFIYSQELDISQVSVWHGVAIGHTNPPSGGGGTPGGYNAPEPTSAMLLLIGIAGLSLKRKQI